MVFLVISGALPAPPTQHSGSARGLREKALPFVPRKALLELWRHKQQVNCSRRQREAVMERCSEMQVQSNSWLDFNPYRLRFVSCLYGLQP